MENTRWKKFRQTSTFDMEFLHKDEFYAKYDSRPKMKLTFPVALVVSKTDFKVFIDPDELNVLKNVDELVKLIEERKTA
ncbi:hypothetical protein [Pareuzebyella sediminis]|uniref:hypothetical protein n=1 Tax=Pareuzebyella sediminis TaxID=2607998 RepID=UPI0011EF1C78|nr:hypothetical protein [Pareuzebyella sediminis]